MNDSFNIQYYFEQGEEAFNNENFTLAADLYKKCSFAYENAALPIFDEKLKNFGEYALYMYNFIVKKHLKEDGFDNIE